VIILLISDIHGNLAALDTVLTAAGPVDAVWQLGDIVDYGPHPRECLARVRALRPHVNLAGNHDLAALGKIPVESLNRLAQQSLRWTKQQLTEEDCAYLQALAPVATADHCTLVHGSPRSPIWEYIISTPIALANFKHFSTAICFFGHTHVPFVISEHAAQRGEPPLIPTDGDAVQLDPNERYLINPGSVGQPRDGDPRAAFALYYPEERRIVFRRILYPVEQVQAAMRAAKLPEPLIERLALGI
jgi:diadenosine tetraphosphatase ApaH/serine/threonine PP2A family protein phosphatase